MGQDTSARVVDAAGQIYKDYYLNLMPKPSYMVSYSCSMQ